MTEPGKIRMLLHDDLIYQILLWLPVKSLLRFKCVCRSWRALIENSNFIKQHLCLHHYGSGLKDKNHSLLRPFTSNDSLFDFHSISIDCFELNACGGIDFSVLGITVHDIVSYNGIICLNLSEFMTEDRICLWNPATRQSRYILRLPSDDISFTTVGFGFDAVNNDYKVVNLAGIGCPDEKRVEVYSLNTNSWRSLTTFIPFVDLVGNPRMPFNNGTCFFWWGHDSLENKRILCFDFNCEVFRSVSFPYPDGSPLLNNACVVNDKIACLFMRNDDQLEIWVLNEYRRVNEFWAKLYTIHPYSWIDWPMHFVSMNGNYIFFLGSGGICRFNVATKEMKNLSTLEPVVYVTLPYYCVPWVEFKESLVSVSAGGMK